ncbi:MAG: sulfatase-like hydrolase/transferase, partial [Candidatus Hodarchaeota archaeon]
MNIAILAIDALRKDAIIKTKSVQDICKIASAVYPNVVSASSISVPSFASIHTGLYPPAHGLRYQKKDVLGDVTTMAEILSENGFRTMACAYTVAVDKIRGTNRGFEKYINLNETSGGFFKQKKWNMFTEWWRKEKEIPSYIFLHNMSCHSPYDGKNFTPWNNHDIVKNKLNMMPQQKYVEKYWNAVEETFEFLVKPTIDFILSERKDTLIFIISDHGESLLEKSYMRRIQTTKLYDKLLEFLRSHRPRGGHGFSLDDQLVYVPLIILNNNKLKSSNQIKRTVDIFPTILTYINESENYTHGYSLYNNNSPQIAYSELMDEKMMRITTPNETVIFKYKNKYPDKYINFINNIKEIPIKELNKEDTEIIEDRLKKL